MDPKVVNIIYTQYTSWVINVTTSVQYGINNVDIYTNAQECSGNWGGLQEWIDKLEGGGGEGGKRPKLTSKEKNLLALKYTLYLLFN